MRIIPHQTGLSFKSGGVNETQVPVAANNQNVHHQTYYENPIDRKTERNLAILSKSVTSLLFGGIAAGITAMIQGAQGKKSWKLPTGIGLGAAALTLGITLPPALYNIKVRAFTREKEMDVFSRSQEAKSSILEGVNDQIHDNSVPFDDKVRNYATVQMANNGQGIMIMNNKA